MSVDRYEGTCDVCSQPIALDFDRRDGSMIDVGITEDGRVYTWIRHYATAPPGANPDCAKFSSVVWLVT